MYRITFIGVNVIVSKVPGEHKNDKVLQWFVSEYPEFTGTVSLSKDMGERIDVLGRPEKYTRHYDFDVDKGKYRKHSYKDYFPWKDSEGKRI